MLTGLASGGAMKVLVTDYGTHEAEKWADAALEQMVPVLSNDLRVLEKVVQVRMKLRPLMIEVMAAIRIHEQQFYDKLTKGEKELLQRLYNQTQLMDLHEHTKKVRRVDHWLDQYVTKIARACMDSEGDKVASSEMQDKIFFVLHRFVSDVQYAERANHVTSRIIQ